MKNGFWKKMLATETKHKTVGSAHARVLGPAGKKMAAPRSRKEKTSALDTSAGRAVPRSDQKKV
jgi:hypothetical protein